MPRRTRGAAVDAAGLSARHRLTATLGAPPGDDDPLLPLAAEPSGRFASFDEGEALPEGRFRWRTTPRIAFLIAVPVTLVLGWIAWQCVAGQPSVVPLAHVSEAPEQFSTDSPAGRGQDGSTGKAEGGALVIHVAGAVNKPGIVRLPAGSRIFEAIAAAGGSLASADLNLLNLAEPIQDGTKIHVPLQGEARPATPSQDSTGGSGVSGGTGSTSGTGAGGGNGGNTGQGGKINLNKATAEELSTLPRVGPVLAKRIVDWRKEHGPFKSAEELDAVDGVGAKMLESLLPLVTVQ